MREMREMDSKIVLSRENFLFKEVSFLENPFPEVPLYI